MHIMSKRQRTGTNTQQRRAKRPIDKKFANVSIASLVEVQSNTDIIPAMTYPGTVTGLRWNLNIIRSTGAAAASELKWVIAILPAGTTPSALNMTTAGSLYDPEQNVLAYGTGLSWNVGDPQQVFTGDTSTMRKLKAGDKLIIAFLGTAARAHVVSGTVMCFIKS